MSQPNPFDHSQQTFPHHQPQPTPEEIAYRHGFQAGYTQGFNEAKLRYSQSTQNPRPSKPNTNSVLAWSSLQRFLTQEDYEILRRIELNHEQAYQLAKFAEIHLKSPLIATFLHLMFAPFSAGFYYLEKHGRGFVQMVILLGLSYPTVILNYRYFIGPLNIEKIMIASVLNICAATCLVVTTFQIFAMGTWAREVNGQIIREWLKQHDLLDD